jgi:hypothetical protein
MSSRGSGDGKRGSPKDGALLRPCEATSPPSRLCEYEIIKIKPKGMTCRRSRDALRASSPARRRIQPAPSVDGVTTQAGACAVRGGSDDAGWSLRRARGDGTGLRGAGQGRETHFAGRRAVHGAPSLFLFPQDRPDVVRTDPGRVLFSQKTIPFRRNLAENVRRHARAENRLLRDSPSRAGQDAGTGKNSLHPVRYVIHSVRAENRPVRYRHISEEAATIPCATVFIPYATVSIPCSAPGSFQHKVFSLFILTD